MNMRYFFLISGFLLWGLGIQPVTVKISHLFDPISGKKVIIVYDCHLEQVADAEQAHIQKNGVDKTTQTSQQQDLEKLADILVNHKEKVLFVSECTQMRMGEISLGLTDNRKDALLIIPRIIIKKDTNPLGNLSVLFADPRSHIDIYAAVNFVTQHTQLKKALDEGTLPPYLKDITIESYLAYIKSIKDNIIELVEHEETFDSSTKEKIKTRLCTLHDTISTYITTARKKYSLTDTNHLLDLYAQELAKNNYSLINNIVEFGNINFDAALLFHINNADHTTIVVQAGGIHAALLEHRLLRSKFKLLDTKGKMLPYTIDENDHVHIQKITEQPSPLEHADDIVKDYIEEPQ